MTLTGFVQKAAEAADGGQFTTLPISARDQAQGCLGRFRIGSAARCTAKQATFAVRVLVPTHRRHTIPTLTRWLNGEE